MTPAADARARWRARPRVWELFFLPFSFLFGAEREGLSGGGWRLYFRGDFKQNKSLIVLWMYCPRRHGELRTEGLLSRPQVKLDLVDVF